MVNLTGIDMFRDLVRNGECIFFIGFVYRMRDRVRAHAVLQAS